MMKLAKVDAQSLTQPLLDELRAPTPGFNIHSESMLRWGQCYEWYFSQGDSVLKNYVSLTKRIAKTNVEERYVRYHLLDS